MAVTETPSTSEPAAANTAGANTEESSGLLDIRDMARSTKKRVTQRIEVETESEEALLASRPSVLRDVVLPTPGAEEPEPFALGTATDVPSMKPSAAGRLPWLVAAGVGFLLLVGGGAALLMRGGDQPAVSAGGAPPAPAGKSVEGAGAPAEPGGVLAGNVEDSDEAGDTEAAQPVTEPMVVAEDLDTDPDADDDGEAGDADSADADAEAAAVAASAAADAKAAKPAAAAAKAARRTKPAPRPRAAARRNKKPAPRARKAPKARASGGSGEPDLNALLDQAAGPVDEMKTEREVKAAPTKKRLTRGDINGTLRSKGGAAQACADQHGAEGMMQIRIRIEPSGKVSSATPQGKFKGSNVGACVARVVEKAKFPAYAGAPMTVTFPFLLQ